MVEFVQWVSPGAAVVERRSGRDDSIDWVLVRLGDGRRLLLIERAYRSGVHVMVEPTDELLEAARDDGRSAWNDHRSSRLGGLGFDADWFDVREEGAGR